MSTYPGCLLTKRDLRGRSKSPPRSQSNGVKHLNIHHRHPSDPPTSMPLDCLNRGPSTSWLMLIILPHCPPGIQPQSIPIILLRRETAAPPSRSRRGTLQYVRNCSLTSQQRSRHQKLRRRMPFETPKVWRYLRNSRGRPYPKSSTAVSSSKAGK